ncbi:MBL fold metallo-hydrolase [Flavobacterium supellecticarium]|uniref:MBL fold metallo-hydrolase n=1 Tax=Flavobacterium supellecticarium TaxID=2565924 RepID=A0A4S4A4T2_9FLAO|nr:MBL fold metallo-hydrolase [Flavobacterium supellecticarium]THF53328.1 MBL fold metallo-hydrolase [Flavobacterium supellecticarium]
MKIIPLSEGIFRASKIKEFTLVDTNPIGEPGALKMAICPFLIQLPDDLLLVDAGLGFERNGKPILVSLLQDAGYEPEQITKVLLSHLHKDHTDGLGFFNADHFETYFPKATLFLQQREMDYALSQPENPSFNLRTLKALQELPNVVYMEADKGTIGAHITFEVTGGHSPFHQVFWFRDQDEIVFYGGDNLPQESYLKYHIAYKTDYDGKKAMALRQKWEQQARVENWKLLLYHDLEKSVIRL